MKAVWLLLLTLIPVWSCTTVERQPASALEIHPPRHVVVLIHGIGGNASHFGHMAPALRNHLNATDQDRIRYEVTNFEYATENDEKDVFEFSRSLDRALASYFPNGIGPQDRISIVAHSQGGLIASVWLLQCFQKVQGFHSELADQVESLTTLGTPFWGAKIAGFTAPLKKQSRMFFAPLKLGQRQLDDMSFGSDLIYWLRKNTMSENAFQQVRVLNLGGYVKWMKTTPGALGTSEYEDDSAVILPSSHANFYFANLQKQNYTPNEFSSVSEFKETNLSRYRVVNAIHLSPVVELPQSSRGIAQVQSDCITNLNCDHPSFKYVYDHIKNAPTDPKPDESSKMSSFLLELNVGLPLSSRLIPRNVSVQFDLPDDIQIGRQTELMSKGTILSKDRRSARLYFTGIIRSEAGVFPKRERTIRLKIKALGLKQRIVETPVKAMQSTFIDLNLED